MDDTALPPGLALLWGRKAPPTRGPKPALTLDDVVRAAIELADADGLAQLSMARVAERLGFTTMAVYRYVKSKSDLLAYMVDGANTTPPAPTPHAWRSGLETWARGTFATYRRHPWLLQVPMSGPPAGPAQLAWMEAGLQNLADVTLPEGPKLLIIQLLHGYVRGEAQLSTDLSTPDPNFATAGSYGRIVRAVITPETHPALTRMVDSGIFDDATDYEEDVDFSFGLDRVLDGIAQMVDQPR